MPTTTTNKNGLSLACRPAEQEDVHAFIRWRYEPPYDIYNILADDDVDQEEVAKTTRYFLDPAYACHAIVNQHGRLVGFCTFGRDAQVPGGDYRAEALDIGMGVHPDWTGQGHGILFASAVLDLADKKFAPRVFRVTVAEFNKRALRVWQKAGFKPGQRFNYTRNERRYVILTRAANPDPTDQD